MRSCPQCKAAYPDDVAVCAQDGSPLEEADDASRLIEPTASISPPHAEMEDVSLGGLSASADAAQGDGEQTRAGRPGAPQKGEKRAPHTTPSTASLNPEDRVGSTLGSYRLVEVIGRGGMGAVYRAEHVRLPGREVALKLLRADYAQRRDSVARFIREAQSVNRIRHRNIVDVSDIVELDDGTTFIIMELLSGDSLGKLIRKPGALDPARILNLLLQICDGLAAAHDKDVVHRDLKPDNVFVSPDADGRDLVKLLDFGVAKLLSGHDEDVSVHTVAGSVIGTPAFMSPEQAGGMQVDATSDIYSLGAIMYELFSGKPPFTGKSFGEFVRKHLNEPPAPLRQTRGGAHADPRIEAIVMTCLEKDPARRYQDARALHSALYEVYASLQSPTGPRAQPLTPAGEAPLGGSSPPAASAVGVAGPAEATVSPYPASEESAPFAALGADPSGQPTPPPATATGTPPADSLSGTGDPLPTPPPDTPGPAPYAYAHISSPGAPPAPSAASGAGPHPRMTATGQLHSAPSSSWKKALALMLGGGALVGAIAGLVYFSAAGGAEEDAQTTSAGTGGAGGPQVSPLSPYDKDVEIRISSEPSGASVFVFGDLSDEPICPPTPCVFRPGEQGPSVRSYVVDKDGYASEVIEVDLADVPPQLHVELEPSS